MIQPYLRSLAYIIDKFSDPFSLPPLINAKSAGKYDRHNGASDISCLLPQFPFQIHSTVRCMLQIIHKLLLQFSRAGKERFLCSVFYFQERKRCKIPYQPIYLWM